MRTALALALAGCHHDPDLPEDLGDRVATVVGGWEDESGVWPSWGNIAWASDGRELYYREEPEGCAPPCRGIRAVDVETTESRLVVGDLWQILQIQVLFDGDSLVFGQTADTTTHPEAEVGIFQVNLEGGPPERVVEAEGRFALSPVLARLAYAEHTTLTVFDFARGTVHQVTVPADTAPIQFSAEGEVLVSDRSEISIVADDGTLAAWTPNPRLDVAGVHQEGDVRELVFLDEQDRVTVVDREGRRRTVTDEGALDNLRLDCAALSPDGQVAALWLQTDCVEESDNGTACEAFQHVLALVDLPSGAVRTIGATRLPDDDLPYPTMPWTMVFSPDGSQLAYVMDGGLYVKSVP
ncbi:MAG: hypothetical protein KC621_14405 [Myxococcales bacterium]|nr:hypothetical protein [Myxococcales bacterium]